MAKKLQINRRDFLKLTGAAIAAAGLPGAAQALAASVPASRRSALALQKPSKLKMNWWGEQEAPGLEAYVKKTIEAYKAKTGVDVETTLSSTDTVISDFQTASAAKNAPDLQYFWNGIYHMESVWLGYVEPLNGLLPDDLLKSSNATVLSIYQGKQYRVGWYSGSLLWVYNRDLFNKAKLDADNPPKTWDEFLAACDKLKTAGIQPMVGGLKDGPFGEWFLGQMLSSQIDSPVEALNLFTGNADWRDPKYYAPWSNLEQLWKAKFLNDDLNSIELYPGIDLLGAGKGAITMIAASLTTKLQKALGSPDKLGTMVAPAAGKGKMGGRPISDVQGLGISSQSQYKEQAADFLKFMLEPEQLNRMYTEVGAIPASLNWDAKQIKDNKALQQIAERWMQGKDRIPYISNLMPVLFWTDAMFVNAQKVVAGEYDGAKAGENAQAVAGKWREQNPDLFEKYQAWAKDLANV